MYSSYKAVLSSDIALIYHLCMQVHMYMINNPFDSVFFIRLYARQHIVWSLPLI